MLLTFFLKQDVAVDEKVSRRRIVFADGPLFSVSLYARIAGVIGVFKWEFIVRVRPVGYSLYLYFWLEVYLNPVP